MKFDGDTVVKIGMKIVCSFPRGTWMCGKLCVFIINTREWVSKYIYSLIAAAFCSSYRHSKAKILFVVVSMIVF